MIASGPARLCAALAIDRENTNGLDLTNAASSLYLADDGVRAMRIRTATRIGITKSPDLPLRFYIEDNPFVSRRN
jgi:DNA-3-methyladenine glycosylase